MSVVEDMENFGRDSSNRLGGQTEDRDLISR